MPTAQPLRRAYLPPLLLQGWAQLAQHIAGDLARAQGRGQPVLVVCRDIHDVQELEKELRRLLPSTGRGRSRLLTFQSKRDVERLPVPSVNDILVSTIILGRGADLKPSPEAVLAGGLHVLAGADGIDSLRVLEQVLGRCARSGQPGSCQVFGFGAPARARLAGLLSAGSLSGSLTMHSYRALFDESARYAGVLRQVARSRAQDAVFSRFLELVLAPHFPGPRKSPAFMAVEQWFGRLCLQHEVGTVEAFCAAFDRESEALLAARGADAGRPFDELLRRTPELFVLSWNSVVGHGNLQRAVEACEEVLRCEPASHQVARVRFELMVQANCWQDDSGNDLPGATYGKEALVAAGRRASLLGERDLMRYRAISCFVEVVAHSRNNVYTRPGLVGFQDRLLRQA